MPSLGSDIEAGTLVKWYVKPGDKVQRGNIVAVVETQKGAIEIEIFQDGTIDEIMVNTGQEVPVGTVLALLHGEGEEAPAEAPANVTVPAMEPARATAKAAAPARQQVSPAARRRAEEMGIELAAGVGTGAGGAVTLADIEKAATAKPAAAPGVEEMRRVIAAAMSRSKREIPHYYLSHTIDFTPALDWLREANRERSVTERMVYAVLLVKALALALGKAPELNGFYREGRFEAQPAAHVGVAISLRRGGLVAPALHHVADKDLDTLMGEFHDLVTRARAGRLRSSEMAGGTITITNLGEQGVETVFPVIYPPQVAMVGFGTVTERPWVVDGGVAPRKVITATLAADHRVSDGHRGALFLAEVDKLLQEPDKL